MIYYNRSKVEKPSILQSEQVENEKELMHIFYEQGKRRKQRDYRWRPEIINHEEVKNTLNTLFNGKCVYCESYLSMQYGDVDHFRPKRNAMNIDGTVNEDHYWWLTYEWENLYLSCKDCNQSKRTRFPVEGKRNEFSGFKKISDGIDKEHALLIDPCRSDDFDKGNFIYTDGGKMIPLTRKAEVTIEVLNLNRENLLFARMDKLERVKSLLESWLLETENPNPDFKMIDLLKRNVEPRSDYADISRDTIRKFYDDHKSNPYSFDLFDILIDGNSDEMIYPSEQVAQEFIQKVSVKEDFAYSMDLGSKQEKEAYFSGVKRIKSIEINNFKIIKSLTLDFPVPKRNEEPWMVLLGENGSGKSSVMQAIALTMVGARRANQLGLKASNFVNRNSKAKSGYVKISMDGMLEPLELHFSKDSDEFSSNFEESKVIMLAFGSTRLMANENDLNSEQNLTSLKNLFNPYATLPNIEEWIADPKQVPVKEFDRIAFELKKILQLPDDKLVYRRKSKEGKHELFVKINSFKTGIRLKELSSGYQSIIAMTLNIIKTILETWGSFSIAEGIVLIDEIGVHLHPKWKLQIIRTLRDIFPAMTFIITTHEPLCLRGVNEGEVVLMKFNEENEVIALTELPSPKGLTVEQLISSKFFGLITSFDPEVELQLNSYYLLKSKLERTKAEQDQLVDIESNLGKYQILDKTKDEILKDEILKPDINIGWISAPSQQEDLKQAIKSIWDETI